jgi:hypothetical protein
VCGQPLHPSRAGRSVPLHPSATLLLPRAVLPGLWPSYTLRAGTKIDTSDTVDKVNRLQITAQGPTSVSTGSSA